MKREDLKWEAFKGAQGVHNRTESAIRLTHLPTGLSVEVDEHISQLRNREKALQQLQRLLEEGYETR